MVDISKGIVGAFAGLGGVVLGSFLARGIPQKVEVQFPTLQQVAQTDIFAAPSYDKVPIYYFITPPSYGNSIGSVAFKDDLAVGMTAFAEYRGKNVELKQLSLREHLASFDLTRELGSVSEFSVYAVDRDGNKSEPKTLFTLDGVLVENNHSSR